MNAAFESKLLIDSYEGRPQGGCASLVAPLVRRSQCPPCPRKARSAPRYDDRRVGMGAMTSDGSRSAGAGSTSGRWINNVDKVVVAERRTLSCR
jgi:hypothetical protein